MIHTGRLRIPPPLAGTHGNLHDLQAAWDSEALERLAMEASARELAAMQARVESRAAVLLSAIGFLALFFAALFVGAAGLAHA